MIRMGAARLMGAAVISVAVCSHATAQDGGIAAMRACAAVVDDSARLRCYDTEMRRPQESKSAAAEVKSVSPAVPEKPTPTPEQAFGFRGTVAREEVDKRRAEVNSIDRLDVVIARAEQRPLGDWVMTLDNGQVWAQKEPDPGFRVKVGDAAVIKRQTLGSYLMAIRDGRATRVARIK